MGLVVQKYGGTSLATPEHIIRAAKYVASRAKQGDRLVVVVSAMGQMTDELVALAHRTVTNPPQREMDMLLTTGERVSMALLSMVLNEMGTPAISFTGSQVGIITTNVHTDARILDIRPHRVVEELEKGKVVIIAGFQGVSLEKEITTLGRGGSDTTAVALAIALRADACEILTDVEGLFTADPRIVKDAKLISVCDYDQGLEFSSLGAKMHPRSLEMARRYGVNLCMRSSERTTSEGTTFVKQVRETDVEQIKITGVSTKRGFHLFKIKLPLEKIVDAFSKRQFPMRFFSTQGDEVTFLVEKDRVAHIRSELKSESRDLEISEQADLVLVSIVGEGMSGSAAVLSHFLSTLRDEGAECPFFSTNALSMTAAVHEKYASEITQKLHDRWVQK